MTHEPVDNLQWFLDKDPEHPTHDLRTREISPEGLDLMRKFLDESAAARKKQARYKIELMFGSGRTPLGQPNGNPAVISVYESGRRLHGGGDEMAYWCLMRDKGAKMRTTFVPSEVSPSGKTVGCGKIITSDFIQQGVQIVGGKQVTRRTAICPHCALQWDASMLTGQICGRWSTGRLAKKLVSLWELAGGDADIYLKYHHRDIRYVSMERQHGTEVARKLRGAVIYPLQNIVVDVANGASLENRFYVFLQQ